MEALQILRALAQHHQGTLMTKLHEVCLALIEEVLKTLSSLFHAVLVYCSCSWSSSSPCVKLTVHL